MKNVFLTLVTFFVFGTAFAQKAPKPGITDMDRKNIRAILREKGEQTNVDYVWDKAKVIELKDLPKEEYNSGLIVVDSVKNIIFTEWKDNGPSKRDQVLAYKTEGSGIIYLRNLSTGELLRPVRQEQNTSDARMAKNAQSKQGNAQPSGQGGILKELGGAILRKGAQMAGQGIFGGGQSGRDGSLGPNTPIYRPEPGYQNW